jgi:hypothetical protein
MANDKLILHVRFAPDGTVAEIAERPAGLDAQLWFKKLTETAGSTFETLSGGRGLFRLTRDEIAAIKAAAPR